MRFSEKEICLKDGRTAQLVSPTPNMAQEMLRYLRDTCGETPYLLRTPEECDMTLEDEATFLQSIADSENDVMILCLVDGRIAGNCCLSRNVRLKTRHRGSIGIALYREFWGLGIGSAMFRELIALAESWGLLQLELDVIEGNDRAVRLYEHMGFSIAGVTPNAIRLPDGTLRNEFRMIRPV